MGFRKFLEFPRAYRLYQYRFLERSHCVDINKREKVKCGHSVII